MTVPYKVFDLVKDHPPYEVLCFLLLKGRQFCLTPQKGKDKKPKISKLFVLCYCRELGGNVNHPLLFDCWE